MTALPMRPGIDRSSMDALVAASDLPVAVRMAIAPTHPLGALAGAARQGILERRLVTAAVLPLRYSKLGTRRHQAARDVVDLTGLLDVVWICVTAGMAAPLLDAAVPAVDVAGLLAGPLGILADSRDPVSTIASRLDPSLDVVASPSFGDLPHVLEEITRGNRRSLHEARSDLIDQWWLQPGRSIDLARLQVRSALSPDALEAMVVEAQSALGENVRRWELAMSLAKEWPGTFTDLLASARALGQPRPPHLHPPAR